MSHDVVPPRPGTATLPTEQPIRFIEPNGELAPGDAHGGFALPPIADLVDMHRRMSVARRFDTQVTALTRQGRLATYPSALGQEAAEIAASRALLPGDWLFPTYRDTIALLDRGVNAESILSFFRGDWHMAFDPYEHAVAPQSTPLATQALHAVGFATAATRRGEDTVCLAMLGDGASSEGDAHEAFNFASVWNAPVVFLIQNNQYAISTPTRRQFAARTLADRAVGYGMPGHYVDGNDAAAMLAVLRDAVAHARAGGGPTLVEAYTYRIESHTNSDDPTRYREDDERRSWQERDPIARLEKFLEAREAFGDEDRLRVQEESEHLAASTRDAMNATPELDPLEIFDHVYSAERTSLLEQRAFLEAELASAEPAIGSGGAR
ncbi:pyruvate dehydrogenase E1 component subunit alpha [Pseudoclavibacter endophyticus]|uniref:2-oxoisovalerate dehydrogenase subunit alpha n=1 Tax=Pseudoclavibacter endophyticus TaxID=1778590 RepID=A0A6H9WFY5_9MICO|nr:thiamine pyrophosphate-dependent enzyme [Pseudoclavibacter endophyticus]KAB1649812.1 pyruvate dehydrogenase (acetyl-transferring) E1 component subunit alpha [Pseudoclavibacter endophyticus]GGA59558.1 pyruvate dehydrogenase E1 component subunit alpha [Pseudoclavibacter endophyticus]